MLLRNLTLSGSRSVHTVRVSTIYQFVTVFNHSDHAVTVFPENLTLDNDKHYRVPPRIYLTLPLFGAGMVESCQREVVYTVVSEGVNIPSTVIGLIFTEENNNINMPFPDMSVPTPTPLSVTFPVQSIPIPHTPFHDVKQRLPIPLPIQLDNSPLPVILNFTTKHDLIKDSIPLNGTIIVGGSVSFTRNIGYVSKFDILISAIQNIRLIIRQRIDIRDIAGLFLITHNEVILGNINNIPTKITGELFGNVIQVELINEGAGPGANNYSIAMLGSIS